MSPKVRFRRCLLKCLCSRYCHTEFLKKLADWYFGQACLFFAVYRNSSTCSLIQKDFMWRNYGVRPPHDFLKKSNFFPDGSGNLFRKLIHGDIHGAEVCIEPFHFTFPTKSPCLLSVFFDIDRVIAILFSSIFQQQSILRPSAWLAMITVIVLIFADNR